MLQTTAWKSIVQLLGAKRQKQSFKGVACLAITEQSLLCRHWNWRRCHQRNMHFSSEIQLWWAVIFSIDFDSRAKYICCAWNIVHPSVTVPVDQHNGFSENSGSYNPHLKQVAHLQIASVKATTGTNTKWPIMGTSPTNEVSHGK